MQVSLLPAFVDNYIFALDSTEGTVVVDPGDSTVVERHLATRGSRLLAMLVTHHHPDHIGGLAALSARHPQARRIGPRDPRIACVNEVVGEGDHLSIGGCNFEVMATPGHTRSHIVYRCGKQLYCGDVLFGLGCGRVFEGSPAQMLVALDRMAALPEDTEVYCAHEYTLANARFARMVDPENAALAARVAVVRALRDLGQPSVPTRIGLERMCNPFLRCDAPEVVAAARRQTGSDLVRRADVFAALRSWKNTC
ncbi:MAG: hydroxyacylglutathione hydrolase [Xanthomonadales bacterium]|nr:Hydroxyacylglutathione hydrolase [Xanthomonadales bacterium]MCC6591787.1 hydroxyacylglutathione hydrolase [Xanthomonadales bacterium]MCE7930224.1 hydroxyacylglutathione hydrolase [Xanthomonadales bacterium PRO6]